MMLNKCLIQWYWVDVTTKARLDRVIKCMHSLRAYLKYYCWFPHTILLHIKFLLCTSSHVLFMKYHIWSYSSLHWLILVSFGILFVQWSIKAKVLLFHFEVLQVPLYDFNTFFLCITHTHIYEMVFSPYFSTKKDQVKLLSGPKKCYFHSQLNLFWLTMTSPAES